MAKAFAWPVAFFTACCKNFFGYACYFAIPGQTSKEQLKTGAI